jgi:hypothetical protein
MLYGDMSEFIPNQGPKPMKVLFKAKFQDGIDKPQKCCT